MNPVVRRITFSVAVTALAVFAFMALRGPQGIPALIERQRAIRALQEENAALQREVEAKRERNRKLRESQAAQELEIRERLGRIKRGEKSFIIPGQPAAEKEEPAPAPEQQ